MTWGRSIGIELAPRSRSLLENVGWSIRTQAVTALFRIRQIQRMGAVLVLVFDLGRDCELAQGGTTYIYVHPYSSGSICIGWSIALDL